MPRYDLSHLPNVGPPFSGLSKAKTANTVSNGDFAQVWKWKLTTASKIGLNITESAASTATGTAPLVQINTLASSTAMPLLIKTRGQDVLRVSATVRQLLAFDGTETAPTYAFYNYATIGIAATSNTLLLCSGGGSASAQLTSDHIFRIGPSLTSPAGMSMGLVLRNGSAPSADPDISSCLVPTSTLGLTYRTAVSGEGSGQTNLIHNRTANQAGVGTNYTLTGSTAKLVFGTTSNSITLPSAGVFLLIAQISYISDITGATDIAKFKLYNTTDTADIGTERSITAGVGSGTAAVTIIETVTTTAASKVIDIYGYNSTAAQGVITSTATTLHYVRLS